MSRYLVSGGDFDSDEGYLWVVDFAEGRVDLLAKHRPTPSRRVVGKGFTGLSRWRDGFLVCGFNAVYEVDLACLEILEWVHRPFFNDLHAVHVNTGRVYLANTGLDAVEVFSEDRSFIGRHAWSTPDIDAARLEGRLPSREAWASARSAGPEQDAWTTESPSAGYYGPPGQAFDRRLVRDGAHLNGVCLHDRRLLASCLATHEVIDARTWERVAYFEQAGPHDVQGVGDDLWLTTVDGYVHQLQGDQGQARRFSVFSPKHCGWCRGLHVGPEHLVVGLTELRRPPKHRWCDRDLADSSTALVLLERGTGQVVAELPFEGTGHPKIFGVTSFV